MNCSSQLALLLLVCRIGQASFISSGSWQKLETQQCLPDSVLQHLAKVRSEVECAIVADEKDGLLVVQFDSDTRQCSLFQYIAVCHLIDAVASNGIGALHSCAAFANARAANFITLSRKLMQTVGTKLRAAWVMSDDADASRSNLVCGLTQQWKSEAVVWSSEGARFDGVSSKMWLENVEFGNLQQGLTWLVRLKRVGKDQPLLDNYNFGTKEVATSLWDGVPGNFGLAFCRFAPTIFIFHTPASTNTFDQNTFVEVGVTSESPQNRTFFSNSGFVPQSQVFQTGIHSVTVSNFSCFSLGFRNGLTNMLTGTVRSVAIMNATATEAEIRDFFGLVR